MKGLLPHFFHHMIVFNPILFTMTGLAPSPFVFSFCALGRRGSSCKRCWNIHSATLLVMAISTFAKVRASFPQSGCGGLYVGCGGGGGGGVGGGAAGAAVGAAGREGLPDLLARITRSFAKDPEETLNAGGNPYAAASAASKKVVELPDSSMVDLLTQATHFPQSGCGGLYVGCGGGGGGGGGAAGAAVGAAGREFSANSNSFRILYDSQQPEPEVAEEEGQRGGRPQRQRQQSRYRHRGSFRSCQAESLLLA